MKNLLFVILVSLSAYANSRKSTDFEEPSHLIPDRSLYAEPFLMDYHLMVSDLLPPEKMELLRVLVFPSFSPEYAISILDINQVFSVEVRQPTKSYWGYKTMEFMQSGSSKVLKNGELQKDNKELQRLQAEYPNLPSQLKINKCSKSLPKDVVNDLVRVWSRELYRVKHPIKGSGGFDGAQYHFSMRKGMRILAGQTWSPSVHLPTGKLVGISDSLFAYCLKEGTLKEVRQSIKKAR